MGSVTSVGPISCFIVSILISIVSNFENDLLNLILKNNLEWHNCAKILDKGLQGNFLLLIIVTSKKVN